MIFVEVMHIDRGMAIFSCQSANMYVSRGKDARFVGLVNPTGYDQTVATATFKKSGEIEDIFPLPLRATAAVPRLVYHRGRLQRVIVERLHCVAVQMVGC